MPTKYDLHLSAYQISKSTILEVEALGFCRDDFVNNTRCDVTAYHGTFRGAASLPDECLWNDLVRILTTSEDFIGGLEEEEFLPSETVYFDGKLGNLNIASKSLKTVSPQPGTYKACDIHVNVNLATSSPQVLVYLEALGLASFDKPGSDGVHRVYSATCESLESGRILFEWLAAYLKQISGLVGKMKFERTTRYFRQPSNAPVLPLTTDRQLHDWLEAMSRMKEC